MLWKEERAIEISLKISNIKVDCIADPAERKKIIILVVARKILVEYFSHHN